MNCKNVTFHKLLYVICTVCNIIQGTVHKVYDMACSITLKLGIHNIYLTDISLKTPQKDHWFHSLKKLSSYSLCQVEVCTFKVGLQYASKHWEEHTVVRHVMLNYWTWVELRSANEGVKQVTEFMFHKDRGEQICNKLAHQILSELWNI